MLWWCHSINTSQQSSSCGLPFPPSHLKNISDIQSSHCHLWITFKCRQNLILVIWFNVYTAEYVFCGFSSTYYILMFLASEAMKHLVFGTLKFCGYDFQNSARRIQWGRVEAASVSDLARTMVWTNPPIGSWHCIHVSPPYVPQRQQKRVRY